MLSYQHGFHAGNFADVHKHTALCLILAHLCTKPAPFCVIDTHAGRGVYDLTAPQAAKTAEWRDGVARILAARTRSAGLRLYRDVVTGFDERGGGTLYPGSPAIARYFLRGDDRLVAMELHPAEHTALRAALGRDPRVQIHRRDGFEGLPALVPPAARRGAVLIDPSYEVKSDYVTVPQVLGKALRRWRGGIFTVWYPLLPDGRHAPLLAGLESLGAPLLTAELTGPAAARGMIGSGLAVLNPPWHLAERLGEAGGEMAGILFPAGGGHRCGGTAEDAA